MCLPDASGESARENQRARSASLFIRGAAEQLFFKRHDHCDIGTIKNNNIIVSVADASRSTGSMHCITGAYYIAKRLYYSFMYVVMETAFQGVYKLCFRDVLSLSLFLSASLRVQSPRVAVEIGSV